ncbi:MAG TPA: hypothetical protein VFJ13_09175 [Paracoccaceae bacterium]|nr:hypothetical protein [Paracoccaceae bacterium]
MLTLTACVMAQLIGGVAWAAAPGRALALALTVLVMPRFGLREWLLLAVALALSAGLAVRPGGAQELVRALSSGAYFAAFILSMMLLREAAVTSASVLAVGAWLTRQPPGRRFVATWFGGHMAGILMNFGAVSLLAPLVQRGVRAETTETEDDRRRLAIRERRQLSALIRGFAWVICWAPTTLTQAIILDAVPGLEHGPAMAAGLSLSAVMLGLGWAEDRLRWGRPRRAGGPRRPFPGRAALDLLAIYTLLVLGALVVQWLVDATLPQALMTVAPLLLVGWVIAQARAGVIGGAGERLGAIVSVSVPRLARDAYLLGIAGYIGITAAALAPVDEIAAWTRSAGIPGWAIIAALPVLTVLGGQVALSPMMIVVFLAAVVAALPELPASPEIVGVALGAGWALSMTAAPNATGALLIAGATGIPSTVTTWRWNGVYSLAALGVLTALAWLVVG